MKDWTGAHNAFSEAYKLSPTKEIKQYVENAAANVEAEKKLLLKNSQSPAN
jgi:hypothetical protein